MQGRGSPQAPVRCVTMDRYAVIVVDLRTGIPSKMPGMYVGEKGRTTAHRDAAKKDTDDTRAWVVVLKKG